MICRPMPYKRILLKLSGEAMSARDSVFHLDTLKRVAEEIAKALIFLLRSDFVTGDLIFVTGGEHL